MNRKYIPLAFLTIFSTLLAVAQAKTDTHLEAMNEASLALFKKLQESIKSKLKHDERNKPENKGFFTGLRNMFSGDKNPQEDLDELATIYQALNYADLASIGFLKENCQESAYVNPKIDPNLCESYPKYLLGGIKGRLGTITSHYLYYDDILKAPTDWPVHALEMYQSIRKFYPNEIFGLEMSLLSSATEIYENRQRADVEVVAPNSPIAALINAAKSPQLITGVVAASSAAPIVVNGQVIGVQPSSNPTEFNQQPGSNLIPGQPSAEAIANILSPYNGYSQAQMTAGQVGPQILNQIPGQIVPQVQGQILNAQGQLNAPPSQVQILPMLIVPNPAQPCIQTEKQINSTNFNNGGLLNPKSVTDNNVYGQSASNLNDLTSAPPPTFTAPIQSIDILKPAEPIQSIDIPKPAEPIQSIDIPKPASPFKSSSPISDGPTGIDPLMKKLVGNEILVLV